MRITERSVDSIVARLISAARRLGRLEHRYDILSDHIKQFDNTANSLALESGRLQQLSKNPRAFDSDGVKRIVLNEHRKILLEEARNNSSLRKISSEEAKWLKREIVEEQSTIRAISEKLM